MGQMRIFLSHSSADRDFANALARALRDAGADVWFDELHLGTGRLLLEISRQLSNRPVFVVVLSKAAFNSDWVPRECEWAYIIYTREPNRIILPVAAGLIDPGDWYEMLWLEGFRRVAAPGGLPYPREEAIERTLRLLSLTSERYASRLATPLPIAQGTQPPNRARSVDIKDVCWNCGKPNPNRLPVCSHCGVTFDLLEHTLRRDSDRSPAPPVAHPLVEYRKTGSPVPIMRPTSPNISDSTDHLIERGKALAVQMHFTEAKTSFEQATQIEPDNFDAWFNLGDVYNAMSQWRDGLMAWERAVKLDPSSSRAWSKRGQSLYHLQQYQESLRSFENAIVLDPLDGDCWYGKSLVLRKLGQDEEAKLMERLAHDLDE